MAQKSKTGFLTWKITRTFVGLMSLLFLLLMIAVYALTGTALRQQLERRVTAVATNLSDTAAGLVAKANPLELHALAIKYARLEGVAYAFIENAKGDVLAYSPGNFPPALKALQTKGNLREIVRQEISLHGRPVYAMRLPILEGQLGAAHIGIWGDVVEQEIVSAVLPLIGLVASFLCVITFVSVRLAKGIVQPIVQLTDVAAKMSRGELSTPVGIETRGEIGELAHSLERMRSSLRAAMTRLNREPTLG